MTTVYLKSGSVYTPMSEADLDMHRLLPGENFIIIEHPQSGALLLQQVEPFTLPPKMYGNISARADRILNTYGDRPNATGVLLAGEKGSGKTQLARLVCARAAKQGVPTIIINAPWTGDKFFKLIQSIQQPCVVMFDEFEKVYDYDAQKKVLTLLDGVFPSKKLFILTSNDKWMINDHMRNRPGRIYYLLDYKGLPEDFVREYSEDNLINKVAVPQIVRVARMFAEFNFDMLKALVEEMNRYGEDPETVLQMLNARPSTDNGGEYAVHLFIGGEKMDKATYYPHEQDGSPLHETEFNITYTPPEEGGGDDAGGSLEDDAMAALDRLEARAARRPRSGARRHNKRTSFVLRQNHLVKFDAASGSFEYAAPEDDIVVRFTRVVHQQANMLSLLA